MELRVWVPRVGSEILPNMELPRNTIVEDSMNPPALGYVGCPPVHHRVSSLAAITNVQREKRVGPVFDKGGTLQYWDAKGRRS